MIQSSAPAAPFWLKACVFAGVVFDIVEIMRLALWLLGKREAF